MISLCDNFLCPRMNNIGKLVKTLFVPPLHLIIRQKHWNSLCVESIVWFVFLLRINYYFSPVNYFDKNMNEVFIQTNIWWNKAKLYIHFQSTIQVFPFPILKHLWKGFTKYATYFHFLHFKHTLFSKLLLVFWCQTLFRVPKKCIMIILY